jgi:hypothetical protein
MHDILTLQKSRSRQGEHSSLDPGLRVIIFINSPLTLTRILPDKKGPRHEIRSAPKSEH